MLLSCIPVLYSKYFLLGMKVACNERSLDSKSFDFQPIR